MNVAAVVVAAVDVTGTAVVVVVDLVDCINALKSCWLVILALFLTRLIWELRLLLPSLYMDFPNFWKDWSSSLSP